jgi:WhiB family redox-sensing transcriptional regulator
MEAQVEGVDLLGDAPEWQERALCSQTDPRLSFRRRAARRARRSGSAAAATSRRVPGVRAGHDERFGIWGGLSERERRKLKRRVA